MALGTYKASDEEISDVTEKVISLRYHHFDCAWIYGNEKDIGKGSSNQLKRGQIKRSNLFLISKLMQELLRPLNLFEHLFLKNYKNSKINQKKLVCYNSTRYLCAPKLKSGSWQCLNGYESNYSLTTTIW